MSYVPIFVDASRRAILNYGPTVVQCATLREAKTEFDRLSKDRQEIATIVSDGKTYNASEIIRMHYGQKPD